MNALIKNTVCAMVMGSLGHHATAGGLSDPVIPVPIAPPPVVSPYDVYIGLQVGPGTGDVDYEEEDELALSGDGEGIFYGVRAGVQRRFGVITAGVEIDYNTGDFEAEIEETTGDGLTGDVVVETLAHIKLRVGTDLGRAFIYGTTGLAYVEGRSEVPFLQADFSDTGGFVGFGSDFRLSGSLSVGAEVLFHDFENIDDSLYSSEITTAQLRVSWHF